MPLGMKTDLMDYIVLSLLQMPRDVETTPLMNISRTIAGIMLWRDAQRQRAMNTLIELALSEDPLRVEALLSIPTFRSMLQKQGLKEKDIDMLTKIFKDIRGAVGAIGEAIGGATGGTQPSSPSINPEIPEGWYEFSPKYIQPLMRGRGDVLNYPMLGFAPRESDMLSQLIRLGLMIGSGALGHPWGHLLSILLGRTNPFILF